MTVTIDPQGKWHSYILGPKREWLASCLPEYAEAFRKAAQEKIDAASDNRAVNEKEK